jgi:hypothetical protein
VDEARHSKHMSAEGGPNRSHLRLWLYLADHEDKITPEAHSIHRAASGLNRFFVGMCLRDGSRRAEPLTASYVAALQMDDISSMYVTMAEWSRSPFP